LDIPVRGQAERQAPARSSQSQESTVKGTYLHLISACLLNKPYGLLYKPFEVIATAVVTGCSTVGLGNNESKVMSKMLVYGLMPVALVAVLVFGSVL